MAFPILGSPCPQFFDANGNPLASGKIYVYIPATTTARDSYPTAADADAATNANANPVVLNSSGIAAGLWGVDNVAYKVVVKDSTDTIVPGWTSAADSIYPNRTATTTQTGMAELATDAETVTGTDTGRVCTPANITAKMAAPGAIGGTTPAAGTFTTLTVTTGIAALSGQSISPRLVHTGMQPPLVSTDGTNATPVITEVYISEIYIPANMTLTGLANFNGSVASGNIKVGLADSTGAIVATSASTAMSGTDGYQRVAFTSTYAAKGPATYYALLFVDNTTARVNCHTLGNFGAGKQTGQTYATGFTTIAASIPTTFTTALGPMMSAY